MVGSSVVGKLFGQGLDCDGVAQTKHPSGRAAKNGAFLLGGVLGIVGGIALLAYGLAPAKDLWDAAAPAFSGGTPPEDLSERLDAAMKDLKGRALIDGFGFLALMAGIVLVKTGLAKPKGKPVEQLVQEEVERRLAGQTVYHATQTTLPVTSVPAPAPSGAANQVFAAPPTATPAAQSPMSALPPRRTHCGSCGSVLVAGGRICPQGHAQV